MQVYTCPPVPMLQARALVDDGYLEALIDLDELTGYWQHMLKDYAEHPASESPSTAMPITLYGVSFEIQTIWCIDFFWGWFHMILFPIHTCTVMHFR